MMDPFPYIMIEQTRYPTVIVGGDRFTGLFGKPRHAHLEHVITTPAYISRIKAYLFTQVFSAEEQAAIARLSPEQRAGWFAYPAEAIPLTARDIARISVDEQTYQANLDRLKSLCEFCLVGTVFADWLPL